MINVGGLKVLPVEVENVINTLEGVLDSSVYGKSNAITGQMVCAKVIVDPKTDQKEMKQVIKKACQAKLDKYKRPVKITFDTEIKATSRFKKSMR